MCMRSGLVIKTAPVSRSSLSSRFQSECQTRGPRDLASVSAVAGTRPLQQPQPESSAAAQQQSAAETIGADSSEATAAPSGTAKTGASRTGVATRPRSLDFLSIVTRFQLARRARAVQLGIDPADNWHDEDWVNSAVELNFIPDDNLRSLCQCLQRTAQCSHCKRCTSYSISVCLSVSLSHAGIVSKRLHVARCSLHCQIAKCV